MEKEEKIDYGTSAILISRVSTREQSFGEKCDPQLNDLKKWAEYRGFKKFYTFATTESGFLREDKKDGWNKVVDCLKKHPSCRVVICTEMSRLSRLETILLYIRDYLVDNKIQLLIKDINFTLLDEYGKADGIKKMVFSLYASLASSEMAGKKERFKRALKDYRKVGYSIGGKKLFGYNRIYKKYLDGNKEKSYYVRNDKEAKEINDIYNWYAYGIDGDMRLPSIFRITKECISRGMSKYLHSKRNVNKCLKEEAYLGFKTTHNKKKNPEYWNYHEYDKPKYIPCEEYECKYEQIIDESLFNKVREIMKKRNSRNKIDNDKYVDKSSRHTTILSKLIVCPNCGKFLVGQYRIYKNIIKHTYRCSYSRGTVHICSYKSAPSMVLLDSAIWAYVKSTIALIESEKNVISANKRVDDIKASIERLKEQYSQYDNQIDAVSRVYLNKIKMYSGEELRNEAVKEYNREIQKIKRERKQYERSIAEKESDLKELEKRNQSITEIVDNDIADVENNKLKMYNYIHLLIEKIIPVFSDNQYSCLQINTFKNKGNGGFYLDFNHSEIENNLIDCDYLIINKRDANRIKIKIVSGNIQWDKTLNKFVYMTKNPSFVETLKSVEINMNIDEIIEKERDELRKVVDDKSLVDGLIKQYKSPIFSPTCEKIEEIGSIADFFSTDFKIPHKIDVEDLEYKRLTFYQEDEVKK